MSLFDFTNELPTLEHYLKSRSKVRCMSFTKKITQQINIHIVLDYILNPENSRLPSLRKNYEFEKEQRVDCENAVYIRLTKNTSSVLQFLGSHPYILYYFIIVIFCALHITKHPE